MNTNDGFDMHESDAQIRDFYRDHARGLDVDRFMTGLHLKLGRTGKRPQRQRLVRRLSLAMAGLLVIAGVSVGAWQVVEHLTKPDYVLVFSDTPVSSPVGGSGSGSTQADPGAPSAAFPSQEPRSVSKLKLADVWAKAAAALGVDPASAVIDHFQILWGADGLLDQFQLSAVTPEGRTISLFASSDLAATDGHISFQGSAHPHVVSSPGAATSPSLVTVGQVLADLDAVGLMTIGTQSGVKVAGDVAALFAASGEDASSHSFPPSSGTPVLSKVVWDLSDSNMNLAYIDAAHQDGLHGSPISPPVILDLSSGTLRRVEIADLSSVSFPAKGLTLGRLWTWTDKSTGRETISSGGSLEAAVLLHPSAEDQRTLGATVDSVPVDARLDGLAFTTAERGVSVVSMVQGGTTQTLWTPPPPFGGDSSLGVSYSLGRKWLLYGSGIYQVTDKQSGKTNEVLGRVVSGAGKGAGGGGEASGPGWTFTSDGENALMALPVAGAGESQELLRSKNLPPMNRVTYDESGDRVWLAELAQDTDEATLWTAQPHGSQLVSVPLARSVGGDFAVSPDGLSILYLGTQQSPATATLRTPAQEIRLSLGLTNVSSPVFSPDGRKVCLVGSDTADGATSLWIYDLEADTCTRIESTKGLYPTFPAFSPDGQRIAFRNWRLGDVWTVAVDSGELTRYALPVADAPIAW
jgi:hypothetical protein